MRKTICRWAVALILLTLSAGILWSAGSNVVYVGALGEPPTIPAGFTVAVPGDTIIVRDGVYTLENWYWTSADSSILLISLNGADACTINADGKAYRHILVDTLVQGAAIGAPDGGFTFVGGHPSSSDSSGGSIFVNHGTDFAVEACVFSGNYTGIRGGGGAIFIASGDSAWSGSIISCQFVENHAGHTNASGSGVGFFGGGAICASAGDGTCEISGCGFVRNYTTWESEDYFSWGGAICCASTSEYASINECVFDSNYIADAPTTPVLRVACGGAIATPRGFGGEITDCTFTSNSATQGGAIYTWNGTGPTFSEFSRNEFRNNVAHLQGGALRTDHQAFPIADCIFVGNSSGQLGGALYLWHTAHEMENCLFVGNKADSAGGAIWRDGTGFLSGDEWENLTFAYNVADSGAALAAGKTGIGGGLNTSVTSSIFAFNDGPAYSVMTEDEISVTFDCCDSYGNVGGSGNGDPAIGNSCFSENPDFCGAGLDSSLLTLAHVSPCLEWNHPDEEDCGLIGARGMGCWLFSASTWLDESSPTTVHAGLDTFRVGLFPDSAIGLLCFDDIDIPDTTTIATAILTATAHDVVGDAEVDVRACLRPAVLAQTTYLVYRTGATWSYAGGADEGEDFGSTSLGTAGGFSMYATDTLATGAALLSWVEDVIEGDAESILFIRPSGSATSGVVFYGCDGSYGPMLWVYPPD